MNDLISRKALLDQIETDGIRYGVTVSNRCTFRDIARQAPTVAAEPVRHARWEHKNNSATCTRTGDFEEWFRCDLCYAEVDQEYPNCPYCTARMDGQGEGDAE